MGIDEILKLIESLQETDIQELEIVDGDSKVRIARLMPAAVSSAAPVIQQAPPVQVAAAQPESAPGDDVVDHSYIEVNSPMVGTFYRAPDPESDPFTKEGDSVVSGQQLCIIEAMKLMNPILSEINGRVVKILAEDAQPVEYGQPLFLLEPA